MNLTLNNRALAVTMPGIRRSTRRRAGASRFMRRCRGYLLPSAPRIGAVQLATGVALVIAPFSGASWHWWLVALFGYFVHGCIGHSIGYHRYFAHRSFKVPKWAEALFTWCGVLGCVGPPLAWSFMHRRHHARSDQNGDPYTAHLYPRFHWRALFLGDYRPGYSEKRLRRVLQNQPLQRFVHRYYFGLVGGYALALLAIDWRLCLFGWAVPVGLTLWMSAGRLRRAPLGLPQLPNARCKSQLVVDGAVVLGRRLAQQPPCAAGGLELSQAVVGIRHRRVHYHGVRIAAVFGRQIRRRCMGRAVEPWRRKKCLTTEILALLSAQSVSGISPKGAMESEIYRNRIDRPAVAGGWRVIAAEQSGARP